MNEMIVSVERMKKDIRAAAVTLSDKEARYLVDAYYQMQTDRIRANHRVRAMGEALEPHSIIAWLADQSGILEQQLKGALDRYSMTTEVGVWMRSIRGVGPVITAGYMANLDITRAPTVGHFWAVCGVDPSRDKRVRGEKHCFSPSLKRLTYILGESFKRTPKDADGYYRSIYEGRKAYEIEKNERGDYADQAKTSLENKKYDKDTTARKYYMEGKLPPGRIDLRSARYAAKLFLAHLHEVWWKHENPDEAYPNPYPIAFLGHAHKIDPPH